MPQWIMEFPWDIFDTFINLLELIILSIPAVVIFMYYRIQSIDLYVSDVTDNGATLLIHNKTNRSIFISDVQFIAKANGDFGNSVVLWNKEISQLNPDGCLKVIVNYTKHSRGKQMFYFLVIYNHNRQKKIKVKIK